MKKTLIILSIFVFIAIGCNQTNRNTKTKEKSNTEYSTTLTITDKNNPQSILYAFLQFAEHWEWVIFWNGAANVILDSLVLNGSYAIFWVTNDSTTVPDEMLYGNEKDFEEQYLQIYKNTYYLDTIKNTIRQEGFYTKGLQINSTIDYFEYNLSNTKFTYSHFSRNQNKIEIYDYNPDVKCPDVFTLKEKINLQNK